MNLHFTEHLIVEVTFIILIEGFVETVEEPRKLIENHLLKGYVSGT